MALEAKRRFEEELRRLRNAANSKKLLDEIKHSEQAEMKTFDLKDRQTELKHELEISKDVDKDLHAYIKFEKKKNDKLQMQMDELKKQIADHEAALDKGNEMAQTTQDGEDDTLEMINTTHLWSPKRI